MKRGEVIRHIWRTPELRYGMALVLVVVLVYAVVGALALAGKI